MPERLSKSELHEMFISSLNDSVKSHSDLEEVPLEALLSTPLPPKVRVYMFNVTSPPGGRPSGEHKAQLILPDQNPGERASFDHSNGYFVLLVGYAAEPDVFILWDAGLHYDFSYSKNVQVKSEHVYEAVGGKLGTQIRHLHTGDETVITSNPNNLKDAIELRDKITTERLTESQK